MDGRTGVDSPKHSRGEERLGSFTSQMIGPILVADALDFLEQDSLDSNGDQTRYKGSRELREKRRPWWDLHIMCQLLILSEDDSLREDLHRKDLAHLRRASSA